MMEEDGCDTQEQQQQKLTLLLMPCQSLSRVSVA
jgi:hypothetical protein